jgi:hypothetical protein
VVAQAMEKIAPLVQAIKDAVSDDAYSAAVMALTPALGSATRYDTAKLIAEQTIKMIVSKPSERRVVWGCHLIHSLTFGCEKSKTLIGKDLGGIPPLLKTLSFANFEARQQAAGALASLVSGGVQKCRTAFQNADGVALTVSSMKEIPPSDKAKSELMNLLCAVSRTGAMAKQILDLKLLPFLMEMSLDAELDVKLRVNAAGVIAGIASTNILIPQLLEGNVIQFCADVLKREPLSDQDIKDTMADRPLEILAHISLMEENAPAIDVSFAIMIAKRARQIGAREPSSLSKADKTLLQVFNNSSFQFRTNELYRIKMETADPEGMLASKPISPTKFTNQIAKLVTGLSDTDDAKASEAARQLAELMQREGLSVKREVLQQEEVFAKLWKFVRQGKLGWDDKWYVNIDPTKLKFKEELGTGAFSTVYRGTLKVKGKKEAVAIKALDESLVDLPDLRCELATLSLLQGLVENMVQFNGYFYLQQKNSGVMKQTKKYHCIVMELMETNLEEILHDPKKPVALSVAEIRRIAYDMALGMSQLHAYGVLHRDLKPANILLNRRKDLPWQVKLADFGYARRDSKESLRKSVVGTPAYLAPELIGHTKSDDVGTPSDVYSYGVILWEMLTRKKPHDGMESAGMFHHVISCVEKRTPIFTSPPDCDAAIGEIMQLCTHSDPRKRPSFQTIQTQLAALLKATGQ